MPEAPAPEGPLIGREAEMARVRQAWEATRAGHGQVVMLTGGRRALDLAVQRKERGQEAYARRVLVEIASHDGSRDVAEAERHYRQAASLAEELGMRPLIAHCHLALGKLYRRLGKRQ